MTLQHIILEKYGIESDKALNGKLALEKVIAFDQENKRAPCTCKRALTNFKIIFMDCNMPVMDGFQATQQIRMLNLDPEIHIVALTAYTTEQFR